MRGPLLLVVVAAASFAGSSDAAAATNDIPISNLAASNPLHQTRFLRIREADEDDDEEERGKTLAEVDTWFDKLYAKGRGHVPDWEGMPGHMAIGDLKELEKRLARANKKQLKDFEKSGETPTTLYDKFDIKNKLETKTAKELEDDRNYQLYLAFEKYWENRGWLNKRWYGQ